MSESNPSDGLDQEAVFSGRYYNSPDWKSHDFGPRGWVGRQRDRAGKLSHGCIAWMLGLPLPIVILAFLWRGCD